MPYLINDLHQDPRIYVIENFLSDVECAHMMARARTQEFSRATVADYDVSDVRTNSLCWLPHTEDNATRRICTRISDLVGLPLSHAELIQVVHYGVGHEYQAHTDSFDPAQPSEKKQLDRGGQRLITALGYLNNVPKGGATRFPHLDITVEPKKGKLLVFHNCEPGTTVKHELSRHAGCPVEKGEKWAFNLWFREGVFK